MGVNPTAWLLLAGGCLLTAAATAAPEPDRGWQRIEPLRALVGSATPVMAGIELDVPLVTEDGSSVPLSVRVDGPMTDSSHVHALHVFAPGNPTPEVIEFHFRPRAGLADVSTRVRLNETQTVWAVALMSDGEVRLAAREVRVTVSGCIGPSASAGSVMQTPRVALARGYRTGEPVEVRSLIDHPMETGLRDDGRGGLVPRHTLDSLAVRLDDDPVLDVRLHRAVAANPYVRFHVRATPGSLELRWRDDTGADAAQRVVIH
jgi:sulfur-oxidizing protein SoxY